MPAGRRWRGKPTQPLSVHAAVRGPPTPPFAGDHAAVRGESQPTVGGSLWYAGKANPRSMDHSAAAVIVKPAGYGLAVLTSQPAVAMVFLITGVCVCLAPEGSWYPLRCPMVFFWGGNKGPGCCGRAEGRGHGHHGPPALAS